MPLDPQAQQVLENIRDLGLRPAHTVTPQEARENARQRQRRLNAARQIVEVGNVENRIIDGPGGPLPIRIYTPAESGPYPILAWFHGGGWVVGDLESADDTARRLCAGSRSVVISVDYRLAPEAKFPGPLDDCYAATLWAAEHADELLGYSAEINVGGDSSGGNLAAAVAIKAAQTGAVAIGKQLLVYPALDRNFDTDSYQKKGRHYNLERDTMTWYWDQYLADPADADNPLACPLRLFNVGEDDDPAEAAARLPELPRALIITAEYDPLCDEGNEYGDLLETIGSGEVNEYEGMIHGFFGMSGAVDAAVVAIEEACEFLSVDREWALRQYSRKHRRKDNPTAAIRRLLDPQAQGVLAQFDSLGLKPFQEMTVAECREVMDNRPRPAGPEVGQVENRTIPNKISAEPCDVPVRIYTPAGDGPWGILVWFHGGGWVIGNLETADATARELCAGANCVVVSVGYRLAPECQFPIPFEDCLAATIWAMDNAEELGDSDRAFAVGGDSAGGNLAAAVCLAEAELPLLIDQQLLVYPVTDYDDFDNTSYRNNGQGLFLERESMEWFWNHYLPNPKVNGNNIYASPLKANLHRSSFMPDATIITAEFDPLRDEGKDYADALKEAGHNVRYREFPGVMHGFFGMPHVIDTGRRAVNFACRQLRRCFEEELRHEVGRQAWRARRGRRQVADATETAIREASWAHRWERRERQSERQEDLEERRETQARLARRERRWERRRSLRRRF